MANKKAVSDEQIIAALLQHGTIKDAAAAAGTARKHLAANHSGAGGPKYNLIRA